MSLSPHIQTLIDQHKAKREAAGLHVRWIIPADDVIQHDREWSAYASSEAVKAEWIASGARKGWRLIEAGSVC